MKYFIGFVVTVFLVIFAVILLVGGGGKKSVTKLPATSKSLTSYATSDAAVSMTIDGPVNADQSHQEVRVTVSKSSVLYEQIDGYTNHVVNSKSYPNNSEAYANFLSALNKAGYTRGDTTAAIQDERGYCSLGNRYIFEVKQGGKTLQRYWTSTCGKTKTYLGEKNLTTQLFKLQVPDYSKLTRNMKGISS